MDDGWGGWTDGWMDAWIRPLTDRTEPRFINSSSSVALINGWVGWLIINGWMGGWMGWMDG